MTFRLCALLLLFPGVAAAQYGDPNGAEGLGNGYGTRPVNLIRDEPIITIVELRGVLPAGEFKDLFKLTDEQTTAYGVVVDSFNLLTKTQRDEALKRVDQLGQAITKRDSAAAEYYRDHLKGLGKYLKNHHARFDDRVRKLLTKDQQKQYKEYRKEQDEAARNPQGTRPK